MSKITNDDDSGHQRVKTSCTFLLVLVYVIDAATQHSAQLALTIMYCHLVALSLPSSMAMYTGLCTLLLFKCHCSVYRGPIFITSCCVAWCWQSVTWFMWLWQWCDLWCHGSQMHLLAHVAPSYIVSFHCLSCWFISLTTPYNCVWLIDWLILAFWLVNIANDTHIYSSFQDCNSSNWFTAALYFPDYYVHALFFIWWLLPL